MQTFKTDVQYEGKLSGIATPLNMANPRTTGYAAPVDTIVRGIDDTYWIKTDVEDTDWEQLLVTKNGEFTANLQLEDVSDIIPAAGTLGLNGGALVIGDGTTPGGILTGNNPPIINVETISEMMDMVESGVGKIGQMFSIFDERSIWRYEGDSRYSVISETEVLKPHGAILIRTHSTVNFNIIVTHNGNTSTGICYNINGGAAVYTAVGSGVEFTITIPANNAQVNTVIIWSASSLTSGLKGGLTSFKCTSYRAILHIDLQGVITITSLEVGGYAGKSINLSGLGALQVLKLEYSSDLTNLDFSGLVSLQEARCNNSGSLSSITMGYLPNLQTLIISQTAIRHIDPLLLPGLVSFEATHAPIKSIEFRNMLSLTNIYLAQNTQLTNLVVENCPVLWLCRCTALMVPSLIIADCPELFSITIEFCTLLTSLAVNNTPLLTSVTISDNPILTSIRMPGATLTYDYHGGPGSFIERNTSLSAEAINQLYTDLGAVTSGDGHISVVENLGSTTADHTIATTKGYLITSEY